MTTTMFFTTLHASWYDRWHHAKDYPAEVSQIRGVFDRQGPIDAVLDLGCGTGRHLELLAAAGHRVVGVDRSPTMVAEARARLAPYGERAEVVESDLLDLALGETFDAVTMMFSVLGYFVAIEDLLAALRVAHRHLREGGLLLIDTLDAAVVLREGPRGGVTVVTDGDRQLLRATTGSVNVDDEIYELRMRLWHLDSGQLKEYVEEIHPIRFFLLRELELLLRMAGFRLLDSAGLAGGQPGPSREWCRLAWAVRA